MEDKKSKWDKRCKYCKRGGKDVKERLTKTRKLVLVCNNCMHDHWDSMFS